MNAFYIKYKILKYKLFTIHIFYIPTMRPQREKWLNCFVVCEVEKCKLYTKGFKLIFQLLLYN